MNSVNGIRKYYVGLGVLMVIALGCLVYAISQAGAAKADKKTNLAVQKISDKMTTYTIDNGVPASLQEAGISDVPSSIKYTKIDSQKYKICIDYKTASSGFDAGWFSLLGGAYGGGSPQDTSGDHSYFDSTVQYRHKKGQNCQTITDSYSGYLKSSSSSTTNPSFSSTNQSTSSLACSSDYDNYYGLQGQATVSSINPTTRTINFSTAGQTVTDDQGKPLPAITSLNYDDITVFCSTAKKTTTVSSLKTGQKVKFFASSSDSTTLDKVQL